MSEQTTSNPKTIASGPKAKDPRKVAAGKRLAAISRQAKEAKRLRQEAQQNAEMDSACAQEETGSSKTLYFVGGLLVVGVTSYLLLRNKEKVVRTLITNREKVVRTLTGDKEESDPVPEQRPTPKKEKFKSVFDD